MKFKSRIGDGVFISLVVYCILTLSMFIYWVISGIWWPAVALSAVLLFVIAPVFFGTYYEIGRDSLKVYCGIFGKSIPFKMIISATDADSIAPAFCLSHRRICVRYLDGEKIKATYISPVNREQFRDMLNGAISSSAVSLKAPETEEEKEAIMAVERAKEELAHNRTLNRAEERAIEIEKAEKEAKIQAEMVREIKKLDDIIEGNIKADEVVLSQKQEEMLEKRKKAEKKLLAKVCKEKEKKERKLAREEKKKAKKSQIVEKQPKPKKEEKPKKETKPVAKKENETEDEKKSRLAQEKASLKQAIDEAKKDQYVPENKAKKADAKPAEPKKEEKKKEKNKKEKKSQKNTK